MIEAARAAGHEIMKYCLTPSMLNIMEKADQSPVTAADLAAHRVILVTLKQGDPDTAVLSEETSPADAVAQEAFSPAGYYCVDPLDGTRDFIAGTGEFAVNIAYVVQGRAVAGVVHHPPSGRVWYAAQGQGAWRQDSEAGSSCRIVCRPSADGVIRILTSRHHASGETAVVRELYQLATSIPAGSSLKYCLIAEGSADLAFRFSPTSSWDTAAPQIVLEEAGGVMVDFNGQTLSYTRPLDCNPGFIACRGTASDWQELMEQLRSRRCSC